MMSETKINRFFIGNKKITKMMIIILIIRTKKRLIINQHNQKFKKNSNIMKQITKNRRIKIRIKINKIMIKMMIVIERIIINIRILSEINQYH